MADSGSCNASRISLLFSTGLCGTPPGQIVAYYFNFIDLAIGVGDFHLDFFGGRFIDECAIVTAYVTDDRVIETVTLISFMGIAPIKGKLCNSRRRVFFWWVIFLTV